MSGDGSARRLDRRGFLARLAACGVAGAAAEALWAAAGDGGVTASTIAAAEKIAGLEFTEQERDMMLRGVESLNRQFETLRKVALPNSVSPALVFDPVLPGHAPARRAASFALSRTATPERPADLERLAFLPVTQLSRLVRSGRVSAVELAGMYLDRLERADAELHCVVTLTRERAMAQARRLDEELARGIWRGPLHGIPWGAKDLLAVRGYPTTWGAQPYRDQVVDEDATVVARLDEAGAVLIAKLTLGALAMGDVWFGGQTCSPWDLREGSSGSSAGPAAAVAAGLVAFAVGTETRGSILSPCTQCGATGLRPTFGRVSRHGAMALSWSMDKIGPIARSVEDCAVVMSAIQGPDGLDETVHEVPFAWDGERGVEGLRVGYLASAFDDARSVYYDTEWFDFNRATVNRLRTMGVDLVPVELPDLPIGATSFILTAEAAAAFDELTRSNRDDEMLRQDGYAWPNTFRTARMIPAVEYLQANRVRRLAMREMARILDGIDVYLSPTYGGDNLLLTNLTGHPAVVVPNGFRKDGTPTSVTFCGNLFSDSEALLLAKAYQDATGFHLRHPPRFA